MVSLLSKCELKHRANQNALVNVVIQKLLRVVGVTHALPTGGSRDQHRELDMVTGVPVATGLWRSREKGTSKFASTQ